MRTVGAGLDTEWSSDCAGRRPPWSTAAPAKAAMLPVAATATQKVAGAQLMFWTRLGRAVPSSTTWRRGPTFVPSNSARHPGGVTEAQSAGPRRRPRTRPRWAGRVPGPTATGADTCCRPSDPASWPLRATRKVGEAARHRVEGARRGEPPPASTSACRSRTSASSGRRPRRRTSGGRARHPVDACVHRGGRPRARVHARARSRPGAIGDAVERARRRPARRRHGSGGGRPPGPPLLSCPVRGAVLVRPFPVAPRTAPCPARGRAPLPGSIRPRRGRPGPADGPTTAGRPLDGGGPQRRPSAPRAPRTAGRPGYTGA